MAKNGEVRINVDHCHHPPTVAADDQTQRLPEVLEIKLQELEATRDWLESTDPPKIQKVPLLLRDHINFNKYYVPRVVSLGPIHHGKPEYELAEEYKRRLTVKFVKASRKSAGQLLKRVKEEIEALRKCFDEEVVSPFDNEDLAWMLFMDGCAVLQAIRVTVDGSFGAVKIKTDLMVFAQQDLFLLENQLPYRLLELLMNESAEKEKLKASIKTIIPTVTHNGVKHDPADSTINHLLDLLRKSLLGIPITTTAAPTTNATTAAPTPNATATATATTAVPTTAAPIATHENGKTKASDTETNIQQKTPNATATATATATTAVPTTAAPIATHENGKTKASDTETNIQQKKKKGNRNKRRNEQDQQYSFRDVQELKAAGIHVKQDINKGDLLTDIYFEEGFFAAKLYLPRITVDDSTGPKFLNLIAYEMCPDFDNDFGVTSYISFLDSLIDHPNDVKELRKARVLHNHLGSDKEVAQLFNQIGTDLVPDPAAYKDVKEKIQNFYDSKWKTWIAEFFHDHFSSPWTIMAFLAALLGLGLTAAQTWYSVK